MNTDHVQTTTDERGPWSSFGAVALHDLVRWNGIVAEVIDVAHLGPDHDQVVLQRLDKAALPLSLLMSDLVSGEVWHFAGRLH
jgi:hypothetical protein